MFSIDSAGSTHKNQEAFSRKNSDDLMKKRADKRCVSNEKLNDACIHNGINKNQIDQPTKNIKASKANPETPDLSKIRCVINADSSDDEWSGDDSDGLETIEVKKILPNTLYPVSDDEESELQGLYYYLHC